MRIIDLTHWISSVTSATRNPQKEQTPEPTERPLVTVERLITDPMLWVQRQTLAALATLNMPPERMFGAEEEELLLRQLRIDLRSTHGAIKEKFRKEEKSVRSVPQPFNSLALEDALKISLQHVEARRLSEARNLLKCDSEQMHYIEEIVQAWTGGANVEDVHALAQFMWLVKRKLMGLEVRDHIMPVLYGSQGGGKSRAAKALFKPLEDLGYVLNVSVSQLADERYLKVLSENFIAFADEMTAAERADVNSLKNIITASILTPRKLGTNSAFKIRQNCTFFGASNRHINEMIFDSTGMRRFYQINCLSKFNWTAVNNINYLQAWRSIDELREEGYLASEVVQTLLKASQQHLVSHDDVDCFIEEHRLLPAAKTAGAFRTQKQIFDDYSSWCVTSGLPVRLSAYELAKRMRNRHFRTVVAKVEGKACRGFYVTYGTEGPEPADDNRKVSLLRGVS